MGLSEGGPVRSGLGCEDPFERLVLRSELGRQGLGEVWFDAGHGDVTIGGCIGPIERRPTAEGTARCAQTVPGRPCRPCRGLVEDDASDDSADVLIVRILTGPRLCVSTLSGGAAGLEFTQAGQGLECGVLTAEDIGDGN